MDYTPSVDYLFVWFAFVIVLGMLARLFQSWDAQRFFGDLRARWRSDHDVE
jgi:hypothetical protein